MCLLTALAGIGRVAFWLATAVRGASWRAAAATVAAAIVLAFSVGAVQWVPSAALLGSVARGRLAPAEILYWSIHPLSAVDLLDIESKTHAWSVPAALEAIARSERGVMVLFHRCESAAELRVNALATRRSAPSKMDLRNYGIGAQILRELGVGKMRLLAHPRKMPSMGGFDLEVAGYLERG